ncbi:MAG TPA: hypothetical protein VFF73_33370 [Planctomycetota bacterium]|nr:hypothetical protein [Planctomycetota bacterium]
MLSAHERRILDAFVDAMIPPAEDGLGPSGLECDVPARFERYLESMPPAQRKLVPLSLWALEFYPIALGPLPRLFSSLGRRERARALFRLEHHTFYPLRQGYMALKLFSFLLWAEHPAVAPAFGYGEHCR